MSEVTSKLIAGKIVEGIKKAGQILGPGFVELAAEKSCDFFARKIGQESPGIKDIDQALEYISKNMKSYLNGYTAFSYGVMKAESTIQGATGSFSRMIAKTATAQVFESTGFSKALGKTSNSSEALKTYYSTLVKLGSMKKEDLNFTGSNGVLELQVDNCPYADMCIATAKEGVSRMLGGCGCVRLLSFATIIEVMTGKQQDYRLGNMNPPKCSGTILEA